MTCQFPGCSHTHQIAGHRMMPFCYKHMAVLPYAESKVLIQLLDRMTDGITAFTSASIASYREHISDCISAIKKEKR